MRTQANYKVARLFLKYEQELEAKEVEWMGE